MLTAVRPLFLISGPEICDTPLLQNMQTILSIATPATPTPIISDTLNLLPSELRAFTFNIHRTLHDEPPCSETAKTLIEECEGFRADLIYCDIQKSTPFIENLLRHIKTPLVIALGSTLPKELVTIQFTQRDQLLVDVFPFLNTP